MFKYLNKKNNASNFYRFIKLLFFLLILKHNAKNVPKRILLYLLFEIGLTILFQIANGFTEWIDKKGKSFKEIQEILNK